MNRHLARVPEFLRGVGPARWFILVFGLLLAAFILVLLTESSSVGRGGR